MMDRFNLRWVALVKAALVALAILAGGHASPALAADGGDDETNVPERVFLPPARATRQLLDRAEQLLAQRRFAEAVQALNSVLNTPEDFFYRPDEGRRPGTDAQPDSKQDPPGDASGHQKKINGPKQIVPKEIPHVDEPRRPGLEAQTYRSLKNEARRLLGELPPEARRSYELQFGATARRKLDEALLAGDMEAVADVTRLYFHTEAGADAMNVLGRYHLEQGRPLAAALCFEQVQQSPAAAAFEPTLSLMLAVSWSRAGQSERSADVLTKMRRRWPKVRFDIAGRPTQMPASEAEAKQWLSGLARARPAAASKALADWTMTGGDSSRAAQVAGGRPLLLRPCWRQRVAADANIEQIISVQSRQLFDQSVPALPAMHPLAVGNVVLMRGPGRLTAVDAESGKIVWQIEPVDDGKHDTDSDSDNDAQPSARDRLALSGEVYERIWQDRTVGTLSSDGELVFSLEDVGAATAGGQRVVIDNLGSRRIQWAGDQQSNVLAAYEVRQSQGKRRWSVGGPGGIEPKLDHAFFLGPPLPLQGRLYVIAEMAGEIRLVVLSADSGRLQWSQQLAVVDDEIAHETSRHTYGISPSFADGTLICPTTVGAVVGVDLTTRLLLWGYQYPRDAANGTVVTAGNWIARRGGEETSSHQGWSDGCPMVSGGRVILTPPESSQLHCLNLRDGRLLWQMDRGRNLYAAGFHGDNVILVGQDAISLVPMVGPEKAKGASLALPEGSMPSGRGYCT
ncbi:MAG: PQQ-like beta-propeller repeat protein, partial [Planctomycetia bacterium]|nr:PQQ-like beta-propeller repeat protein [Planctomycetia bacterium]